MDNITKYLNRIAYKFPKGYPDMNDSKDKIILENELEQVMGLNENFNPLTFYDLKKRGGFRFGILSDKIEQGTPFNLIKGNSTPLKFESPEYEDAFKSQDASKIKNLIKGNINMFPFFKDDAETKYSISDILKDATFGGKGKGSSTSIEDYNLKLLNDLIVKLVDENNGNPINITVNGKTYNNLIGATTQKGTPKSDFNIINQNNTPVIFISHKKSGGKGPSANDFIRWSGYTRYASHPEVEVFNEAIKKWLIEHNLEGLPRNTRFISSIKDKNLIQHLIYGINYGGEYSADNVNTILQGKITLTPSSKETYELGAEHVLNPPAIPEGDYAPYLTAAYRSDRKMFGIENNEAIAMTKKIAYSSSNVYELKGDKFIKIK